MTDAPTTDAEVEGFLVKLVQWRSGLPASERRMVDSLVAAAEAAGPPRNPSSKAGPTEGDPEVVGFGMPSAGPTIETGALARYWALCEGQPR